MKDTVCIEAVCNCQPDHRHPGYVMVSQKPDHLGERGVSATVITCLVMICSAVMACFNRYRIRDKEL